MPDLQPDLQPDPEDWLSLWKVSSSQGYSTSSRILKDEEAIPMKFVIEEEALLRPLSSMNLSLIKNDKIESVISDNIQTFECSTSSSCQLFQDEKNDLLFIDTLREELMGMDNICEVSSNHEALPSIPHGEAGIITFCSYDKNEKQFAFYFKDSQDMASVVGVGLQYARVILDKECKIKVEEIPRDKWEQALPLVQSDASYVHKSLKLELPKSSVIGGDTSFPGRPLLWDLAKYFILKDIVTLLFNHNNEASSSNQPLSSEKTISQNDMNHSAFRHLDTKGKRTVGGDDDGDTENCERQGKPLSPKHLGAVIDTIVAIELLKGGTIVDANFIRSEKVVNLDEFHDATKARLRYLDDTIIPQLEFNFKRENQDEVKTIQSTIGEITFNTDEGRKWIHYGLKVDFCIGNEYKGNGQVERGSYKQLDLNPDSGTESTTMVQTVAHKYGRTIGNAMEASVRPNGIGGGFRHDETTSQDDTRTRQYETSGEKKRAFTKDGMIPLWRYDEHKIGCHYVSEDGRPVKPVGLTDLKL